MFYAIYIDYLSIVVHQVDDGITDQNLPSNLRVGVLVFVPRPDAYKLIIIAFTHKY